ncbi:MAG: hypothetical protein HYX68_28235 [Planctomycetes bacterium]|nr:hypothetical protein [Planctomycetota bacterium]
MQAFFTLAAVSTNRQRTFRAILMGHLVMLSVLFGGLLFKPATTGPVLLGMIVLVAGIVEGALLIGWRLTQIPKSQALEFLLVSSVRPSTVLIAEALVGLTLLGMVTLGGVPILLIMALEGVIGIDDVPVLLAMPLVFGAVTGLGLTVWAYEPERVRRWGERLGILGILIYLIVGVLAGERLGAWLSGLPFDWGTDVVAFLRLLHDYNPFGAMQFAMEQPGWAWTRLTWTLSIGIGLTGVLLIRGALRLHGHFHDEHYRPRMNQDNARRQAVSDEPLSWWAVKRVSRYAGRINVWLAGGFGLLYAAYAIAGPNWPTWLGRAVFDIFDRLGGLAMLATALMLLATVPAAFQYGLWDSNAHDRCRRLELLLLTDLDGASFWQAASAAACRRGRGYFVLAIFLLLAAAIAGQITWVQVAAGLSAGVILWGFYFTLGFRAFASGRQANQLGIALTVLFPLVTMLLAHTEWRNLAALMPPGSVYFASTGAASPWWLLSSLALAVFTLWLARWSLQRCESDLRYWYDQNHCASAAT